jgi:hypothetical protein
MELDAEKIAHKIEMEYQKELQNGWRNSRNKTTQVNTKLLVYSVSW